MVLIFGIFSALVRFDLLFVCSHFLFGDGSCLPGNYDYDNYGMYG